eukprot:scaffold94281_cov33-Prasinocladus_malaysianus.AAC.1
MKRSANASSGVNCQIDWSRYRVVLTARTLRHPMLRHGHDVVDARSSPVAVGHRRPNRHLAPAGDNR